MDIEQGFNRITMANILARHEQDINNLKTEVFGVGTDGCKMFSMVFQVLLWVVIYLKTFNVV